MQKTRPRRTGKQAASGKGVDHTPGTPAPGTPGTPPPGIPGNPSAAPVGKGRPTHVRTRLILAVTVVAAAIAGAGVPSLVTASGQLSDSQDLVTLAEQTQDALTLAHSLADERDEVTPYIAAGRPKSKAPSEQQSARVDRQVEELRADPDTPAAVRKDLDTIDAVRRAALTGKSGALEAHQAYSATVTDLHRLAEQLADGMPPSAGAGAHALAELDTAVQQAAATRGLLLAALNVPTTTPNVIDPATGLPTTRPTSSAADTKLRDALSAAAQQARVRSDAALADFQDSAPAAAKASYDSTVTGPEVNSAEKYLATLTDQPSLADKELGTSAGKVQAALSARIDAMRGAESALYDRRVKELAQLRDDDVTALEIRIALLGTLMLLAVGIATAMARTLTQPLSVLRRGSARLAQAENPSAEEPVAFTGRNDEFAQVVRSVNALHAHAAALGERVMTLEADRKHLVGQRQRMADAREQLKAELAESAAQLERTRTNISATFVNLALRTLGLVERQLAVIEGLEEREQDPERLATLFKLDHFATVMRRHSENLLVLAGTEHVQQSAGPVPLVDVVRAAVSEIERYERVRIAALPPHAHLAGFAADDLSHLLAELMENATSFSPPDLPVEVSGWLLENGEVMLSVQDEGIGMTADRLAGLNARLADFTPETSYDSYGSPGSSESPASSEQGGEEGLGLGLYVVARLAHRHGVRVRLREQKQGGVAAVVVLPKSLLAPAPSAAVPTASSAPVVGGTHSFSLPGADAEVNSNVLSGRSKAEDPLVALAEDAVRHARTGPEEHPVAPETPAETTMELLVPIPAQAEPGAPEAEAPESGVRESGTREAETSAPETSAPETFEPAPGDGEAVQPGPLPAENDVRADRAYATGPTAREAEAEPSHDRTPDAPDAPGATEELVTDKGLPKRTPKITAPATAPRQRGGSVDAEALRRRLGGFRRGAEAGYREVEAEIAEGTGRHQAPAGGTAGPAQAEEATGGTVEEASS
ncbi:nitrate- and nitrite sensing domain-containing protein [Streptomyces sp. NPDC006332]|uniref:sensor histidine kinase n=1 Tax=Streptomyces sp. NPDC006332 TaxID=3155456 RepID=UPI0033AEAD96